MTCDRGAGREKFALVILSEGGSVFIKTDPRNIGKRVVVNHNGKKDIGTVIKEVSENEIRKRNIADDFWFPDGIPILTENMIKLCYELKDRYFCGIADAIKMLYPPDFLKLVVRIKDKDEEKFRSMRAVKLFEVLSTKRKLSLRKAKKICSLTKLLELEGKGLVEIVPDKKVRTREEIEKEFRKLVGYGCASGKGHTLTEDQEIAIRKVMEGDSKAFLIHGVTASGKTEVYLRAIEEAGGGAIFLLPEISLTTFLLSRIRSRFPEAAVLHSGITKKQRTVYWFALRYGITNIVIGARSALFSPVQNLRIIVVDEEHDQSYKQTPESGDVFYDAREVALIRAKIEGAKVIFGSATPSIEMYYRTKTGQIELIQMKNRIPGMSEPKVKIVDLRKSGTEAFLSFPLSPELKNEIEKRIEKNENVILLFTRRGWALYVMCTRCGYKFKCSHCDSFLVYHRDGEMVCHWCERKYSSPDSCQVCGSDELEIVGFGTERVEEELRSIFGVPVFRMDSDVIRNEKHAIKILGKFAETKPAILVGTQMVSKGFDFPSVTLVGVILADTEFTLPEFRADERAFSLMVQVVGRSGRKIKDIDDHDGSENLSIIQTYSPDNPVLLYAVSQNYEAFFEEEMEKRVRFGLPPVSEIAVVTFSGKDERRCWDVAHEFEEKLRNIEVKIEKPVRALRYLVGGKYNVKMLIRLDIDAVEKLRKIFKRSKFFIRGVKITLDVSPQNIL